MPLHGLRRALAAAILVAASAASATPLPIRIYPLDGDAQSASAVDDARALLASAIPTALRRGERLVPAHPLFLDPTCGRIPAAACLAKLAGSGVVIAGTVKDTGSAMIVALRAVDAAGQEYGPVGVAVDSFVQSADPLVGALLALEHRVPGAVGAAPAPVSGAGAPAPAPRADPAARHPVGAASPAAAAGKVAPPPVRSPEIASPDAAPPRADSDLSAPRPVPRAPAMAYRDEPARAGGAWRRPAGIWTASAGAALLAGGATLALMNRQLAKDLEERFAQNRLTREDASRYDRVDIYNFVSTSLLVAGGVAATTGIVLWSTAPEVTPLRGGATLGVRHTF